MLEAAAVAVTGGGRAVMGRSRSLTEEDLEELKGCLDLGFGFSYHEIPELRGTLPGLELCYSMTRRFLDEQRAPGNLDLEPAAVAPPIPDWKISGPGKNHSPAHVFRLRLERFGMLPRGKGFSSVFQA
jgi:hypothetical protein